MKYEVSPCFIEHQVIKTYRLVEIQPQVFLISELDTGQWSAPSSCYFTGSDKRLSGPQRREIPRPLPEFSPMLFSP
jgi:hypothetical protein